MPPLRIEYTVVLPGIFGRFNHFGCDAAARRLVVAAFGNETAEVQDLENGRLLKTSYGLREPTGVVVPPQSREVFIAYGDDGSVRVFDAPAYGPKTQICDLDDADNLRFDDAAMRLYVGFGAGALAAIDPVSGGVLDRIPLSAHPESFQLESAEPRIFVNIPDAEQIAVVDLRRGTVVAQWPMKKWRANFPMALKERHQRVYVGCRHPARLVVFDTEQGLPVSDVEISGDADNVFFDAKRQHTSSGGKDSST